MFVYASFLTFTAAVGLISWLRTRKDDHSSASSYFLANNSLSWYVVAGSLVLTNLSTEQLVGLNGSAYRSGAVVIAWEVIAAVALVIMAVFFLPRYWAGKISTIPQFLETRFDSGTRRIIGFLFLLSLVINFLPFVLYSGSLAMNGIFDVAGLLNLSEGQSIWMMVWGIGIVGAIYAIFGGLKAVAISDTINGIGLLIGGLMVPFLGLMALGGGNVWEGWSLIVERQGSKIDPVGDQRSSIPLSTLFTGMLLINVFYWCTNQTIAQRVFGAKSLAEGQKGVLTAAFLKLLGPIYLALPGIIAIELIGPDLSNGDLAYPKLVQAVLPQYLVGFFGAVMFGAILSSYNSALHSSATLFGLDIYRGIIRPNATDQQTVFAGKIFAGVLALFAMLLAPTIANAPDGLFVLMKKINAIFNIPILAVVVMGMITRSVPAYAAKIALFMGMAIYITYSWLMGGSFFGIDIHWLHFAGVNFAFLCLFMIVSGVLSQKQARAPAKPEEKSWSWLYVSSIAIIVLVISLYVGLHALGKSGS